jgi:hypothetical protein
MLIKKQVDCCLSKETSIGIKRENNLIHDVEQTKKIKLLFLYSFLLESYTCDDTLPDNVLNNIINLCGCTNCTSTRAPVFNIEAWQPDLSNYNTQWIADLVQCEAQPMKWVADKVDCITEIIVVPTTTLKIREIAWIAVDVCCMENTKWVEDITCCTQSSCSCGSCSDCKSNYIIS